MYVFCTIYLFYMSKLLLKAVLCTHTYISSIIHMYAVLFQFLCSCIIIHLYKQSYTMIIICKGGMKRVRGAFYDTEILICKEGVKTVRG